MFSDSKSIKLSFKKEEWSGCRRAPNIILMFQLIIKGDLEKFIPEIVSSGLLSIFSTVPICDKGDKSLLELAIHQEPMSGMWKTWRSRMSLWEHANNLRRRHRCATSPEVV